MKLLYLCKCRFLVERTNAWLEAFKMFLVGFETKSLHWKALNLLAFNVVLLCIISNNFIIKTADIKNNKHHYKE